MEFSLDQPCRLFGYSRQAYWKGLREKQSKEVDSTALLNEVRKIRKDAKVRCEETTIAVA